MHQYLIDTAFAAKELINIVVHDSLALADLAEKQRIAVGKESYFDAAFMHRQMEVTANYWHARFHEAHHERAAVEDEVQFLEAQILDKRISLEAIAAALLQLAKQGISSVRGKPANCPAGRKVHGVDLKEVVWAGRNQSQHYENPREIGSATEGVFAQLSAFDTSVSPFDPKSRNNLAFEVVSLLGWQNYAQYEQDMISLLG